MKNFLRGIDWEGVLIILLLIIIVIGLCLGCCALIMAKPAASATPQGYAIIQLPTGEIVEGEYIKAISGYTRITIYFSDSIYTTGIDNAVTIEDY